MAKVETDWLVTEIRGKVGDNVYFMRLPNGKTSIRHCPPSHQGDRYWHEHIKHPAQDAENQKWKRVMARVSEIWHDPEQKAAWIERHRQDPSPTKSGVPYHYMKAAIIAEEYHSVGA